jgi:hypothetical protein
LDEDENGADKEINIWLTLNLLKPKKPFHRWEFTVLQVLSLTVSTTMLLLVLFWPLQTPSY